MNNILKSIDEIIANVKTKYINAAGLVSSRFPPDDTNLLDHMEDYAPLMLYLGEKEFVRDQILRSGKFTYRGLICNRHRVVSYLNNEYLSALFDYYDSCKDANVGQMIEKSLASLKQLLMANGFIKSHYNIRSKRSPSVTTPMTGALLEVLLTNYKFSDSIRPMASRILNNWINIPFFKKYGLFPSKHYFSNPVLNRMFLKENLPIPLRIKNAFEANFFYYGRWIDIFYRLPWGVHVQVCKDNTNMVFALIQAYRVLRNDKYKEAIRFWIESVREKLFKDNLLHRFWQPSTRLEYVELTETFALVDILCDTFYFVDQDNAYLEFAEEIVRPWLCNSRWSNGLFPRRYRGERDHLDDQTDFGVSMLRLFQLTGKEKYYDVAVGLREGIMNYHYTKNGYVTSVAADGNKSNKIEPKYNVLLLKLLILLNETKKIYGDNSTHQLMKDR